MADETPERPEPAPEPTPAPEPEPIAAEPPSVESLQAELDEERHARRMYEETLASLQNARGAATVPSSAPAPTQAGGGADPYIADTGITRSGIENHRRSLEYVRRAMA